MMFTCCIGLLGYRQRAVCRFVAYVESRRMFFETGLVENCRNKLVRYQCAYGDVWNCVGC